MSVSGNLPLTSGEKFVAFCCSLVLFVFHIILLVILIRVLFYSDASPFEQLLYNLGLIQKGLVIEGRKTQKLSHFHQTVNEDKIMLRPRIGSRPPKCERRCRSCEHCEAIQVPTNPQAQNRKKNSSKFSSIAYARVGGSSNYKPMSWKCKCGNLIFNP
ncbi:EPIDERMAL PATTERNING FACTOR-like protein 2 [Glycine max]|nr:EPIDERMAL PATTERNING FACTOR-like protein 2 [Glycine max]